MNRNSLKNLLARQFDSQVGAFLEKSARFAEELTRDKAALESAYGQKVVSVALANGVLTKLHKAVGGGFPAPTKAEALAAEKVPAASTGKKRRRRRRRLQEGFLAFSELPAQVCDVINATLKKGSKFTGKQISDAMTKKGLKFDRKHITLVLSRYVIGLTERGKQVHPDQPHLKINSYEVTGEVAVKKGRKS